MAANNLIVCGTKCARERLIDFISTGYHEADVIHLDGHYETGTGSLANKLRDSIGRDRKLAPRLVIVHGLSSSVVCGQLLNLLVFANSIPPTPDMIYGKAHRGTRVIVEIIKSIKTLSVDLSLRRRFDIIEAESYLVAIKQEIKTLP